MTPQERKTWVRQMGARGEWWDRRREAIIEPEWEIVDAHCHLWTERRIYDPTDNRNWLQTSQYLLDELFRDTGSGHKVTQCMFVECGTAYHAEGPANLRAVGETEFVAGLAEQSAARRGATEIAAIVAFADLRDPELDAVLDAHERCSGGRVRGIRHSAARMEDPSRRLLFGAAPAGLYADPDFRRGVARLGERGLVFDALQFHFQLDELEALARAVPGTAMVINHFGMPIGYTGVPADQDPVFAAWARQIEALAALPNLVIKLGGLASVVTEYDGNQRDRPPSSEAFVEERGAYYHHAIQCMGPQRCMFESNFPVDSVSISYAVLWNAHKIIAMNYDASARRALLGDTARRVYRT